MTSASPENCELSGEVFTNLIHLVNCTLSIHDTCTTFNINWPLSQGGQANLHPAALLSQKSSVK